MDGITLTPTGQRALMSPVGNAIDVVAALESLTCADEFACRAVEAICRHDDTHASSDFERSFRSYVHATNQIAGLAMSAHMSGDDVRAAALTSQSVLLLRQLPGRVRIAVGLLRSALVGADGLDPAEPLRFIAERALQRPEVRSVLGETTHAHLTAAVRAAFTESALRFEPQISRVNPTTQHVALSTQGHPLGTTPPPVDPSVLSGREREVVRLIAEGLTNREIGFRLGVKGITVNTFVSRIFSKLGVDNRAAAAAYAVRNGLCDAR